MSFHLGTGLSSRRSEESKRLTEIVFASYRSHASKSLQKGVCINEEWMSKVRADGFERAEMRGDTLRMCESPHESASDYVRRGLAESPDRHFYILDDPSRLETPSFLVVSSDAALKILALGFLP